MNIEINPLGNEWEINWNEAMWESRKSPLKFKESQEWREREKRKASPLLSTKIGIPFVEIVAWMI